jgi:hypothetical protein
VHSPGRRDVAPELDLGHPPGLNIEKGVMDRDGSSSGLEEFEVHD